MENKEVIDAIRSWIESVALVPPAYARYAPLIIDGLLYFLGRLPPDRLDAIVADQAVLDSDASADERLITLLRQCPTLHKLGQTIARQTGLAPELRSRLQALESLTPTPGRFAFDELIARELGPMPGLTVADNALAEGSVAYVVPFEWQSGAAGPPQRGVFKALKPQAEERLLEDLAIWPELGAYLAERSADLGLPALDLQLMLDGVARLLRNEIRLDAEQDRLRSAARFYANSSDVVIPYLFTFCTPRLTAMQRVDGVKVTDRSLPAGVRRALSRTIVDALLAKPFWCAAAAQPFFHADPHAGNLFATPDGRLAIFDWALTTRLNDAHVTAVVQVLMGAAALDETGVSRALGTLGTVKREGDLEASVTRAVREVRRGAFPGFAWLTALLDELGRGAAMTFPEQTALFRKSLLTLAGVVHDVWPNASIDEVLVASGARRFAAEAWLRPLAPFESRAFATHVSNDDLLCFMSSLTWAPTRYLLGAYRDALDPVAR